MKKILFAALVAVLTIGMMSIPQSKAKAQSTYTVPTSGARTITTADTLTHTSVPSKIMGFQYTYDETSGTSAGKIYFEGSIDNSHWVHIDSSNSLVDQAAAQSFIFLITRSSGTQYRSYRYRNSNTSGATGTVISVMLRRFDD